ncbi:hypothetical protein Tco_0459856 [Tanacetum coccineum]
MLGGKERSVSARSSDSRTQRHQNVQREAEIHYQSYRSRKAKPIHRKRYHKEAYLQRMEVFSESEDNGGGCWKSRSKNKSQALKKTTYPNHGEDPEDHLKIFQAAAKVERWAMATWCHMFNSMLTGSVRVWFDDLPPESVDNYDDLKKAFLANFFNKRSVSKILIHARLHDNNLKSMDEMMRATTVFLRGERKGPAEGSEEGRSVLKGQSFGNFNGPTLAKGGQEKGHTKLLPRSRILTGSIAFHQQPSLGGKNQIGNSFGVPRANTSNRQKKRSQALERNKAIQEEVERLVEANIMKKVHYHNWLSNPVMVKKYDDS